MVILVFRLFFELALSLQGQHVVFQMQRDVFPVHARQFRLHDNFAFGLKNVDRRAPARRRCRLVISPGTARIVEESIHTVLQHAQVAKRIPSHYSHGFE